MNAKSKKSKPKISAASRSAISSPALESGPTPCALPDGPMSDLFGREVVPAPVSARRAKAEGLQTLVTSGLIGRDSSASAGLQRSLENRLMMRLDTAGSTLFKLTWKGRTTPLGRRYLERAASARRTSGSGCTSWPTPQMGDGMRGGQAKRSESNHAQRLVDFSQMAAWHTPKANDSEKRGEVADDPRNGLVTHAHLASWPSPRVTDDNMSRRSPEAMQREMDREGRGENLALTAHLATWLTPTGEDSQSAGSRAHSETVNSAAHLSGWATPKAQRADQDSHFARGNPTIGAQATLTVSGETRIGYSARDGIVTIGNGAQLNPAHSRWLMGLPRVFCDCAVTAMQSARRSPRNSSKPSSKSKSALVRHSEPTAK